MRGLTGESGDGGAAGWAVRRLALKAGETYSGDATSSLQPAEAFRFLPAKAD